MSKVAPATAMPYAGHMDADELRRPRRPHGVIPDAVDVPHRAVVASLPRRDRPQPPGGDGDA
ncbi:hypothetical protein FHX34_10311 [Actinoplanes teichomyceticus]|uniref:Uncharacterized protein n=1 Tax=Actinoplanes teichomyceticus TaxID=1867 RepID=A0A561W9H8_ACTTI|nr:hypothetical protein FHX34_10311 [Actinoplanes teichomyceticus]